MHEEAWQGVLLRFLSSLRLAKHTDTPLLRHALVNLVTYTSKVCSAVMWLQICVSVLFFYFESSSVDESVSIQRWTHHPPTHPDVNQNSQVLLLLKNWTWTSVFGCRWMTWRWDSLTQSFLLQCRSPPLCPVRLFDDLLSVHQIYLGEILYIQYKHTKWLENQRDNEQYFFIHKLMTKM